MLPRRVQVTGVEAVVGDEGVDGDESVRPGRTVELGPQVLERDGERRCK